MMAKHLGPCHLWMGPSHGPGPTLAVAGTEEVSQQMSLDGCLRLSVV